MNPNYAILLDGGFVTKALRARDKCFPTAEKIVDETQRICSLRQLEGHDLLRIYYYDAPPAAAILRNPIDSSTLDLKKSEIFSRYSSLINKLELKENFAVRRGETVIREWKIGNAAAKNMMKAPRALTAKDLVPNIQQKGVDLRIGLDIALLSLRRLVQTIVIVSADSDLIPAFKLARREGVRVLLDHLHASVRPELKIHADIVI